MRSAGLGLALLVAAVTACGDDGARTGPPPSWVPEWAIDEVLHAYCDPEAERNASDGTDADLAGQHEHRESFEGHGFVADEPGQVSAHREGQRVDTELVHARPDARDPLRAHRTCVSGLDADAPSWATATTGPPGTDPDVATCAATAPSAAARAW